MLFFLSVSEIVINFILFGKSSAIKILLTNRYENNFIFIFTSVETVTNSRTDVRRVPMHFLKIARTNFSLFYY